MNLFFLRLCPFDVKKRTFRSIKNKFIPYNTCAQLLYELIMFPIACQTKLSYHCDMSKNPTDQNRFDRGVNSVLVALTSNVFLAVIKIVTGILGNSYALMADGIESTLDIFASVVVLGGIKISSIPADEDHP